MELHFTCTSCQKRLKVKGSAMGSKIGCPGCSTPLAVPRSGFAQGTLIAGFEIVRPLGKGGMGEVYLARQLSMGREIALKVLSAEFAAVPGAVERFVKEVHVAAKLEHTHIVAAYDAGQDEGLHYMAMSYVPGQSLAAMLKPGVVLAERDALTMTWQLAQALDYAWSTFRIIHRDIKPANILFDAKGEPKLADMGLSKSLDDAEALTMSGSVMGTPNYMSPEQAEGAGDLDLRADIYSLGATLYHAVTGQMPFAGSSIMAVLRKQAVEILPDPREFNPHLSEHFVGLLQIMLAKNRDDRYADWKALIHDLDFVLDSKPPSVALPGEGKSVLIRKGAGHGPQKKIVIPKEGIHPHPAPAAAPRPKPAMKPRDKALVFGGVAVLGLAVLATVLAVNHSKQRAEQQRLQAQSEAQIQAQKSAETRDREAQAAKSREQAELWQVAADFAAANPEAFDRAIANFEDAGKRLAGTKYELMAKNETARIHEARAAAVAKALADLEARAKELADRKDFDAAAEVFAKYQGAYAADLAQQRTAQEQKYRTLATEAAAKMTEAGRAAKDAERAAIAAVAEAVYVGDPAKAQQACRAFLDDPAIAIDKAEVKRIAGWLDQAAAADKTLLATFEAQKGQTIPLVLDGARADVRIAGIRGDRIQIEQKKGVGWASAELTTAQIPLDVQHARLKEKLDPAALGLWAGSVMLKANRPDLAAKQFQAAGPLATALLAKTEGAKTGQRETDAQAAFAQVLQAVGLPAAGLQPEAIAERIQPGKVTVAQASAALRHLDAYAAAFGDTQHAQGNAAVAAALRPALEAAQRGGAALPASTRKQAPDELGRAVAAARAATGDIVKCGPEGRAGAPTFATASKLLKKGMILRLMEGNYADAITVNVPRITVESEGAIAARLVIAAEDCVIRGVCGPGLKIESRGTKDASSPLLIIDSWIMQYDQYGGTGQAFNSVFSLVKLPNSAVGHFRHCTFRDGPQPTLIQVWAKGAFSFEDCLAVSERNRIVEAKMMVSERLGTISCARSVLFSRIGFSSGPLDSQSLHFVDCVTNPVTVITVGSGPMTAYALAPDSPAKGIAAGGRDPGALLDAQGNILPLDPVPPAAGQASAPATAASRTVPTGPGMSGPTSAARLSPKHQVERFIDEMKRLNPAFDGQVKPVIDGNKVLEIEFRSAGVTNIAPVREFAHLRKLSCTGGGPLEDLSPLQGMELAELTLGYNPILDLTPLKGMPLTVLTVASKHLTDLSPLSGMPLKKLNCNGTSISDLRPLAGAPLQILYCNGTMVGDLKPLKGMPLTTLLLVSGRRLSNLEVLSDMPLNEFQATIRKEDLASLRACRSLKTINRLSAAAFWKRADAGDIAGPLD